MPRLSEKEWQSIPFEEQKNMLRDGLVVWHYADVLDQGDRSGYFTVPLCNDEEELA